ncbi:MAG: hypothetical protein EPN21_13290 [Methylococcaceae bacterium]|nr:MAG: hypothetical protein EPN21_13290 [Methylococcaceae bacterium]
MVGGDMALLAELAQESAMAQGVGSDAAQALAAGLIERLQQSVGAGNLYVPSFKEARRATRDAAVIAAFRGNNRDEVCARYGISPRQFYRILHAAGPRVFIQQTQVPEWAR